MDKKVIIKEFYSFSWNAAHGMEAQKERPWDEISQIISKKWWNSVVWELYQGFVYSWESTKSR